MVNPIPACVGRMSRQPTVEELDDLRRLARPGSSDVVSVPKELLLNLLDSYEAAKSVIEGLCERLQKERMRDAPKEEGSGQAEGPDRENSNQAADDDEEGGDGTG